MGFKTGTGVLAEATTSSTTTTITATYTVPAATIAYITSVVVVVSGGATIWDPTDGGGTAEVTIKIDTDKVNNALPTSQTVSQPLAGENVLAAANLVPVILLAGQVIAADTNTFSSGSGSVFIKIIGYTKDA